MVVCAQRLSASQMNSLHFVERCILQEFFLATYKHLPSSLDFSIKFRDFDHSCPQTPCIAAASDISRAPTDRSCHFLSLFHGVVIFQGLSLPHSLGYMNISHNPKALAG